MNYKQAALAFAINSALFEPAISVRKHRSLNTTKHPLKGPTARGCKALFLSHCHPLRGPRFAQFPPPPPPPGVRSRLGSRSAREGHNSCSISGGARLPPSVSRRQRKDGGRGARARQWRPGPRPLLLPRRTCSGKGHVCSGRTPPLQAEASSRERRAGSVGSSPRPRGGCLLAPRRRALLGRGMREQRRHCERGFPRAPRRGGCTKAARRPTPAGGEGPASLRALGSGRLAPFAQGEEMALWLWPWPALPLFFFSPLLRPIGGRFYQGGCARFSGDLKKGVRASSPGLWMGVEVIWEPPGPSCQSNVN